MDYEFSNTRVLSFHFHTKQISVIEVLIEQHVLLFSESEYKETHAHHHPGEMSMLYISSKMSGYL